MPDNFRAVTWNVYFGTDTKVLEPILTAQLKKRVSLFLMQEAGGADITKMLKDNGLKTFVADPQYRIAWNPDVWVGVDFEKVRLSSTNYFQKDGKTPEYSDSARGILSDKQGRTLDVVSYHTPAHVQYKEENRPPRRYQAMVESFIKLGHMADDSECRGFLAGGDDNWDENTGIQTDETKPIFLGGATGLRQLQAPSATHGKARQIDDFRIKRGGGIKPIDKGWVAAGGGDHKLHGRTFAWR